jgi:hypothetical protein
MEPVTNQSDPQTDRLLRLLALKRHEQPPPGYFDYFAGKVIARIEAAEIAGQSSWWQRLVAQFDARPMLACAYGVGVGAILVFGVSFASGLEGQPTAGPTAGASLFSPGQNALFPVEVLARNSHAAEGPELAGPDALPWRSSTHPVTLGPPSFLLQGAPTEAQLVNWPRRGN